MEDRQPHGSDEPESARDLIREIEELWEQLQGHLPPEERTRLEGSPVCRPIAARSMDTNDRDRVGQLRLFPPPEEGDFSQPNAVELFDEAVPLARRVTELCRWIAARRHADCGQAERALFDWLLRTRAAAIPLYEIFPDDEAMELSILRPDQDEEDEVKDLDASEEEEFLLRFSGLEPDLIPMLQEIETKYLALLGLIDWEVAFDTFDDYRMAREVHEIVVHKGLSGLVAHEREAFAYLATRDWGIDETTAMTYQRYKSIFLFAKGIAVDEAIPAIGSDEWGF